LIQQKQKQQQQQKQNSEQPPTELAADSNANDQSSPTSSVPSLVETTTADCADNSGLEDDEDADEDNPNEPDKQAATIDYRY
jgi:hypothetical protein